MRWSCGYLVIIPFFLLLIQLELPSSRVMGIRDEMSMDILEQESESESNQEEQIQIKNHPTSATFSTIKNHNINNNYNYSASSLSRWKLLSGYSTSTFKPGSGNGRSLRTPVYDHDHHDSSIVQMNVTTSDPNFLDESQQEQGDDQGVEVGDGDQGNDEEEEEEEEEENDSSIMSSSLVGEKLVTVKNKGLKLVGGVESQSENLLVPPRVSRRNSAHLKQDQDQDDLSDKDKKEKDDKEKEKRMRGKKRKEENSNNRGEDSSRPIIISQIRHYKSRKSFQRTTKAPTKVNSKSKSTLPPQSILNFLSREQGDQPLPNNHHLSFFSTPTDTIPSSPSSNDTLMVFGRPLSGRKRNSSSFNALQRIKLMSSSSSSSLASTSSSSSSSALAARRNKWNGSSSSNAGRTSTNSTTLNGVTPQVLLLPQPTTTKSPLKKPKNYLNTTTSSSSSSSTFNNISSSGQTSVEWSSSSSLINVSASSSSSPSPFLEGIKLDDENGNGETSESSMETGTTVVKPSSKKKNKNRKNKNNKKVSVTREVTKDFSSLRKKKNRKKSQSSNQGTTLTTTMPTTTTTISLINKFHSGSSSVGVGGRLSSSDDEIVRMSAGNSGADVGVSIVDQRQGQENDDDSSLTGDNEKEFFPVSVNINVNRAKVSGSSSTSFDPEPSDNLDENEWLMTRKNETDMSKLFLYDDNQLLEEDLNTGGSLSSTEGEAEGGGGGGVGGGGIVGLNGNLPSFASSATSASSSLSLSSSSSKMKPDTDIMTKFLRMVETQNTLGDNCTAGTAFNLGEGVVDRYAQERFRLEAEVAVNRANMLTRLWKYAQTQVMESEYLLHASLFSMVEFDDDIFAAGNCYDKVQYKNYTLFCPYAYRLTDGHILVKDLAVEYKYLSNTSEWFYIARKNAQRVIKNFSQFSRGYNSYTYNESAHTPRTVDVILNVTYEDGKWSKPYFDCGGGNIWMMTYTVPFFGYKDGHYFFKGTSGIDIDLRRVDIDQCPLPDNSTELNIFAASDKCKNATTKCVPIKGLGFRRGSYRCECQVGFYFPNVSSTLKYFNGTVLEEEYERKLMNDASLYDDESAFECLHCPVGCDSCEDDRPCVVTLNWLMRSAILILQSAIIAMLPIVGLFTWKYSDVKVVRAASPVLLRFIVLGAFFIYCTILVMYPSPSLITCTLRVWLREIGFSLAYGALMLKTWRISVIFRVRSAKAVKITDLDLMKRLGIIVSMFTALLVIRTLVAPPISIVSLTADDLKAWLCKSDWWDHSFTIMELIFLVWGIRLCIVVRKAPSEFNESKFISLAIYNEFLLSVFLNISMLFLQSPANPDLLYIIFFCHVQLTMTLLLCLIFGSKAYMVFRGHGKGNFSEDTRVPTFISKSRSGQKAKQASGHNSTTGVHSSTTSTSHAHDPNFNNSRLSEDVQEEFRRLYYQLEELKERNMRLGNRHLVAKIKAMQDAADNIWTGPMGLPPGNNERGASSSIGGGSGIGQGQTTELLQVQGLTSQGTCSVTSKSGGSGSNEGDASGIASSKSNKILSDISEEESSSSLGPWKRKRQSLLNRVKNTKKLLSLGSKSSNRQEKDKDSGSGDNSASTSAVNNISVLFSPISQTVKTIQRVLPVSIVEKEKSLRMSDKRQGSVKRTEMEGTKSTAVVDDDELPHGGVYIGELNPVVVTKRSLVETENASLPLSSSSSSGCKQHKQQQQPGSTVPLDNQHMDKSDTGSSCKVNSGTSVCVIAQVNVVGDTGGDGNDDDDDDDGRQTDDDDDDDDNDDEEDNDNMDESIELDMEQDIQDMDEQEGIENIPLNLIRRRKGKRSSSWKEREGEDEGGKGKLDCGSNVGQTTDCHNNDDDDDKNNRIDVHVVGDDHDDGHGQFKIDKKKKRVKQDKSRVVRTTGSSTTTTTTTTTTTATATTPMSTSSSSHSRSGSSSKIVLDLDDKSRFTEEIAV